MEPDLVSARYRSIMRLKASCEPLPERAVAFGDVDAAYRDTVFDPRRFDAPDEEMVYFALMMKLALDGVYEHARCLRANGPMGAHGYNRLMKRLLYEYALRDTTQALTARMMCFVAHTAAYPLVPPLLVDLKNCVLCLMETEHSLEHRPTRLTGKLCGHIFETHSRFLHFEQFTMASFGLSGHGNRAVETTVLRGLSIPPQDEASPPPSPSPGSPPHSPPASPSSQEQRPCAGGKEDEREYEDMREMIAVFRTERAVQKYTAMLEENVGHLNSSLVDMLNVAKPKTLAYFVPVFLRGFLLGARLKERVAEGLARDQDNAAEVLARHLPPDLTTQRLRAKLFGAVDEHARGHVLNLFYLSCLPFNYKYFKNYRLQAVRVLWLKHMESLGHTCEAINGLICALQASPIHHWVGADLPHTHPGVDPLLVRKYWVAANLHAFCNTWRIAVPRQADDPTLEPQERGLFVLNDSVGFRHFGADTVLAGLLPYERVYELLARYDVLLTKF